MAYRKKISRKKSKRSFSKGVKRTHKKNRTTNSRGGIRL